MSNTALQMTYTKACKILEIRSRGRVSDDALEKAYDRLLILANRDISSSFTKAQCTQANKNLRELQDAWRTVKAGRHARTVLPKLWSSTPFANTRIKVRSTGRKIWKGGIVVVREIFCILVNAAKRLPSFIRAFCKVCNATAQDVSSVRGIPKVLVGLLALLLLISMLHGCCMPNTVAN